MSKKFFVRKSATIIGLIGALSMSFFNSCTQDNPTALAKDVPSYTFSGSVLDGYTGKALGGAIVTYYDDKGDTVTTKTNLDGGFSITKIPYGDRSFFFSYKSTGTDTTKYTTAAVTLAGSVWENLGQNVDSLDIIIKNIAGAVKLYPLAGTISGTVLSQVNDRSELNAVANTVVKVTFTPKDNNQKDSTSVNGSNVEVGPRTFEASTDASGRFSITGLPVSGNAADKVSIKVVSVTSGGIDWAMVGDGIAVELVKGQSVPVGQIVLKPIVLDTLKALADNFKTGVVTPEHTFEISYSAALDSVASYAVLYSKDDGRNVVIATTISGKKVTINPAYSLVNNGSYQIKTFVYGLKGSSAVDSFDVTAAGGGLADVVSSNILTDTKSPVYNFAKKTAITFTFTDSIVGQPSVQVTNNDISFSVSNKTLTITPKSIWKDGTANVTVVLASGKTVSFSTALLTENALSYVTSNIYDFNTNSVKNGLGLQDPIVYTTNKAIENTVKVILTQGGVSLPTTVTVAEGGQQIDIQPVNALKAATSYTVTITVETKSGESKSSSSSFTTTAADFYPIFDNVRIGNDATMPRLDFAPNANIIIKMNNKVTKATASLSGGVNVQVAIKNDTIVIDPEVILTEGTAYNLSVTAEDSLGNTISGAYVTGLVPRALIIILASNIITADNAAIVNADRSITPWFKLSSAPVAASIKAVITTPSVDAKVTVNGDTLFVDPVADFTYEATPIVTITGVAADGNYISFNKTFTVMKKPVISIVKSNVLNDNYEGAINVPEDVEMWYKLSRSVNAASITAKVNDVDAVVRVSTSGDTIFVKSVKVLNAGSSPKVRIKGLDSEGLAIDLLGNNAADGLKLADWPSFTVRPALFPVASNTWGVKGKDDPVKNFAFYDTMWVKFSQPLSKDLLDITWNAAAPAVDVVITANPTSNPNATAWVNGDTLFVLPDNRVAISYGKTVGFSVAVKTALGQASANIPFEVETTPLNLFVKVTNTKDANGEMREDFGPFDTVFVVSSVKIDTILAAYSAATPVVGGAVPDAGTGALRSRVRLSAGGDTIFYVPATKLISGSTYSLDFDVRLKGESIGTSHAKALDIAWKVKSGVVITAMNVMTTSSTFRPFKVIGDSLVVTFSKAIDTSASAPTLFTVNGFGGLALTKVWSNGLKTVTIKNTDTLSARPYSIAANDYTTTNTTYDYTISFDVTCSDGEEKTTLIGENSYVGKLAIKTEQKLALVGSNMVPSHTSNGAITVGETPTDLFLRTGAPTLVFSRAIDTSAIKTDAVNQYQNFIKLVVNGSTLPLEFTLAFSNGAKTVTITPVVLLDYAKKYDVIVTGVPALGMKTADAFTGAGNVSSVLTNEDFETAPAPAIILSAKTTTIAADTPNGYTPMSYNATVPEGHFMVRVWKTAWNANYADSVDGYQFRVRSYKNGAWTSWYIITATANNGGAYNPFSAQVNGTDRYFASNVNVAGEGSIYNALKVADADDIGTSYQNGDRMLNDSTIVQIQSRAFVDNNGTKSYAQWSTALSYADGVAPGDPIYGSTNVTVTPDFTVASADRATNATIDSSNFITVVFPEDMDIATTPAITFYDGANTGSTAPAVAASSKWIDARTYKIYVRLASGVNYLTAGPGEWYYKVSVNGMKDYSGVTLQNSGTAAAPAPGNNVLWAAFGTGTAPVQGNLNAGAGNGKPGFYQFP